MEAVWVALIVATAGMASTLLLSHLQSRQRRAEKAEDYARQDAVAERLTRRQDAVAAKVAEAATQAAEAATLLLAANERVAAQTAAADTATQEQLREIHGLVNSNLTAAMRAEYEAVVQQQVVMQELSDLRAEIGRSPSPEASAALEAIQARVAELHANLTDRLEATKAAEAR